MHLTGNTISDLLREQIKEDGISISNLPNVKYHKSDISTKRTPIVYEPSIVIVGQGKKIGYLGDQKFIYDSSNYLVVSVPLPFECQVSTEENKPYLAISISLNLKILAELIEEMDHNLPNTCTSKGYFSTPLTPDLYDAAYRLLKILPDEEKSRILGCQLLREISYWVLCGEQGDALRSLVSRHTHFSRIARSLNKMHKCYSSEIDIKTLADETGMSVSAFHYHFKEVTSISPLQYLKQIRLHKARMILNQKGATISCVAEEVGYHSHSQFSREFKRFFNINPSEVSHLSNHE